VYLYKWPWEDQVQLSEPEGAEELAQEESHRMDNEKFDDDYKLEKVVDEKNL